MGDTKWLVFASIIVALLAAGVQRCGEIAGRDCVNVMGQCYNMNVAGIQ